MADRRGFLKIIGGALLSALGAALAVPAAIFYTAPARQRRKAEAAVDVGALDRLAEGVPVRVPVIVPRRLDAWTAFTDVVLGAAWLVRKGAEIKAFSTACPHAGCSVDWDGKHFACPCHGSTFSTDGVRTDGPSPRDLDTLDVEVKEGRVLVAYKRFRQGVRDKEPA
jgi:Rieske Fe-S protein